MHITASLPHECICSAPNNSHQSAGMLIRTKVVHCMSMLCVTIIYEQYMVCLSCNCTRALNSVNDISCCLFAVANSAISMCSAGSTCSHHRRLFAAFKCGKHASFKHTRGGEESAAQWHLRCVLQCPNSCDLASCLTNLHSTCIYHSRAYPEMPTREGPLLERGYCGSWAIRQLPITQPRILTRRSRLPTHTLTRRSYESPQDST